MSDLRSDMQNRETYIGDAVYASFSGGMIKLRTETAKGNEVIWVEPETLSALIKFASQFWTINHQR